MRFSFAPLEGLTNDIYRRAHAAFFGGADDYYTPFYTLTADGLSKRDLTAITASLSEQDAPPTVVQLLTNRAPDFCVAARQLADLGCVRLNLNLGCPSGTVSSKGRGAGFLARREELDRFLDSVFSFCQATLPALRLSVKTRVGYADEEEFSHLMEIYNRYPIAELILHPRLRTDMYRGRPRMTAYRYARAHAKMPLCYNGDIFCPADLAALQKEDAALSHVMIGRGAVAHPAIFLVCKGEKVADLRKRLRMMHDRILEENIERMGKGRHLLCRMADIWNYQIHLFFEEPSSFVRRIHRAATLDEYRAVVSELFCEHPLREGAAYRPPLARA